MALTIVSAVLSVGCARVGAEDATDGADEMRTDVRAQETNGEQTYGSPGLHPPMNESFVPDVVGADIGTACRTLTNNRYGNEVQVVGDGEGVEPGRVVAQDPAPGYKGHLNQMVVLGVAGPFALDELPPDSGCGDKYPGDAITLDHLYGEEEERLQGPDNDEPLPDVVGMELEEACRTLRDSGYWGEALGQSSYDGGAAGGRSDGVEPGRVVAQDPKPGYEGSEGEEVLLIVSEPFPEDVLAARSNCPGPWEYDR